MKSLNKQPTAFKIQITAALAIATASFLAPDKSVSKVDKPYPGNYCVAGEEGDCILLTTGEHMCTSGMIWNDCA